MKKKKLKKGMMIWVNAQFKVPNVFTNIWRPDFHLTKKSTNLNASTKSCLYVNDLNFGPFYLNLGMPTTSTSTASRTILRRFPREGKIWIRRRSYRQKEGKKVPYSKSRPLLNFRSSVILTSYFFTRLSDTFLPCLTND